MSNENATWFPLFEFQDYSYQSIVAVAAPLTGTAGAAPPPVTARTWGMGQFACGQAFQSGDGYTAGGKLVFKEGIELAVQIQGTFGKGVEPASFQAVGCAPDGPIKGATYQLVGWVFPESINNGAGRVLSVRGSVRAVAGPDSNPTVELGGLPLDTVGVFEIRRESSM